MMDLHAVREASLAVSGSHLFIYLVPEAAEEAARLGVTESGPRYFALRAAALGAVPWQVVHAAFYNFSPRAVEEMAGVWEAATPERWQAARFAAVRRALERVGSPLGPAAIAEARALIDPVASEADLAGKPLAAANAAVEPPSDPLVALWQQLTVLREWRGDAHIAVLASHHVGGCECNVLHAATGRMPEGVLRATRRWSDADWAAAASRLVERGWLRADGAVSEQGKAAREQIEVETDVHCAALWAPIGEAGARRLAALVAPIHRAFAAAGTFAQLG